MRRIDLENYLGQHVEVKMGDGETFTGWLHKTGEQAFAHNPSLFLPRNYYFMTPGKTARETCSYLFRCSHVKKIQPRQEMRGIL